MNVVSNTSPIHYLVLIDQVHSLESLFGKIIVPQAVVNELRHPSTPNKVRDWIERLPDWMVPTNPSTSTPVSDRLGPGEQEAIHIALDINAELLIIDDREAKREATALGITCIGTLTVLLELGRQKLLVFEDSLERLCDTTNFRISPRLQERLLKEFRERSRMDSIFPGPRTKRWQDLADRCQRHDSRRTVTLISSSKDPGSPSARPLALAAGRARPPSSS